MKTPKNIVITGASSGLGAALAVRYAAPGITLYLHGRDEKKLGLVARECEKRGAKIHTIIGDVTDAKKMEILFLAADKNTAIDLVIANAGISAGMGSDGESAGQVRKIFATNIDGVINTVQPFLAPMVARKRGQIAIISSLAGLRGLPSSPAYSASKACVRLYGEGLRGWLSKQGVGVSVVCPGYIKTPMTDVNSFPMPFIMSPEKAADIIARGLARNKSRIAFPRMLYWPLWWLTCLPTAITDPLFASLPAKSALPQ